MADSKYVKQHASRRLKIAVVALVVVLGILIGVDIAVYQATEPGPTMTVTVVPHYV